MLFCECALGCVCVCAINVGRHFGMTHQLRSYSAYLQSGLLLVEGAFYDLSASFNFIGALSYTKKKMNKIIIGHAQ